MPGRVPRHCFCSVVVRSEWTLPRMADPSDFRMSVLRDDAVVDFVGFAAFQMYKAEQQVVGLLIQDDGSAQPHVLKIDTREFLPNEIHHDAGDRRQV